MTDSFEYELRNRIDEQLQSSIAVNRYGIVQAYNPDRHAVKLTIQPEGILTSWIPIHTLGVGNNGAGLWIAPTVGQLAHIAPIEGHTGHYKVIGFEFNGTNLPGAAPNTPDGPPVKLNEGEMLFRHENGCLFRATPTGFYCEGDWTMNGNVTITKNLHVLQDINSDQNIIAAEDVKDSVNTLEDLRQHYDEHTHIVKGIGGPTLPPDQQDE